MRRLISFFALCLALLFGAAPSFAADSAHGGQLFSANCAACHMGGGNVVNAERTLKQGALEAYLADYSTDHEAAIAAQVTKGKNAMPRLPRSAYRSRHCRCLGLCRRNGGQGLDLICFDLN